MLHRLILKAIKFQLLTPKHLSTVVKNIFGGPSLPPSMSNRVKNIAKVARVAELEENPEVDGSVILDRD